MDKNKIWIEHITIKDDFNKHLKSIDNKRILFSGIFGSGKSTFLKEFFLKYSEEYICLTLYPVNYSVANNDDVFELIK